MASEEKLTLVLGASPNPSRYSYKAVRMLREYGHPVIAIGLRQGETSGVPILLHRDLTQLPALNTVTLYLNPRNQEQYLDWIGDMEPKRVIFNPGTYNPKLVDILNQRGISFLSDCTLIMLQSGTY